jgi:hypothetical protein
VYIGYVVPIWDSLEQFYVWLMGHEVRPFNHTLDITCNVITILIHISYLCITIVIMTIQKYFQDKFVYSPNYKQLQCDYEWLGIYDSFSRLEFKNLWLEETLQHNCSTLGECNIFSLFNLNLSKLHSASASEHINGLWLWSIKQDIYNFLSSKPYIYNFLSSKRFANFLFKQLVNWNV